MKLSPFLVAGLAVLSLFLAASPGCRAEAAAGPVLSLNVRDFGAKGDGVADDTAALQAAANELARETKTFPRPWNAAFPEVVFPEGTYLVTRTIIWGRGRDGADPASAKGFPSGEIMRKGAGAAVLRGLGKATIRQATRSEDVFYFAMARRILVENLGFEGGRRSLKLYSGNLDVCCLTVRDCRFADSGDYAIEDILRKTGTGERMASHTPDAGDEFTGYLQPGPDGRLADVDDPSLPIYYNSTLLHVSGCEFVRCRRVLFTGCDMNAMDHCRIETSPEMTGACIRNLGMLRLDEIDGLAYVVKGNGQRWIDNDDGTTAWTIARRLRLRCDGDAGMCVVHNLVRYRPAGKVNPSSVVLEDCEVDAAGCPENGVVWCAEVPNIIAILGCRQTGAATVPAVAFAAPPGADYFRTPLSPGGPAINAGALAYTFDPINAGIDGALPVSMQPYRREALPPSVAGKVALLEQSSEENFPSPGGIAFPSRINVADCGAKADGTTDDTAAVQRAFDRARDGGGEVVFPGGVYRITGEVTLPPEVSVRGLGNAAFVAPDEGGARFLVPDARRIAFADCSFDSFQTAVRIAIGPSAPATVLFDNCVFNNTSGTAIECRSAAPDFEARTATRLRITDCGFYNNLRVLDSNVGARLDTAWISTYYYAFRTADGYLSPRGPEGSRYAPKPRPLPADAPHDIPAIRNEGVLRVENVCGVPPAKTLKEHYRWIENSGRLFCDFFRFGGETGGMLPLVVRPVPGIENVAIVQNSWFHRTCGNFYYPDDPEVAKYNVAMVECQGIPDLLCLRENVGFEKPYPPRLVFGETVQIPSSLPVSSMEGRLFFSGNQLPETWGLLRAIFDPSP